MRERIIEGRVEADDMNDGAYWIVGEGSIDKNGVQLYNYNEILSTYDDGKRVRIIVQYLD